jgi:hypothetical protein
MARGITEDEVWKACDALLLEGARPTIERVRQKLGRGSPNTVSPMLETWFRHLGARIKDPGAFAAPTSTPEPIHQAAQHLWEVAQAEARRDLDDRLQEGLAAAKANVEAEKERATIADAAAFSANSRSAHLQVELDQLREVLETERSAHAATAARLDAAQVRCVDLQKDLEKAREAGEVHRAQAALATSAADERAQGAERRAALEIERERLARARAEKSLESIAKRFEEALRGQVSATEQLNAAEGQLAQLRGQAKQHEVAHLATVSGLEGRVRELEAALATAKFDLGRAAAQDALVEQLVAKLKPKSGAKRRRVAA